MIEEDDEFGIQCRAQTLKGKRCSRKSRWLVKICSNKESWLAALRTGWPRMVRGMKEPEYRKIGLCYWHGCRWRPYGNDNRINYLYGIGKIGNAKKGIDPEYDAAHKIGDQAVLAAGFGI